MIDLNHNRPANSWELSEAKRERNIIFNLPANGGGLDEVNYVRLQHTSKIKIKL